MGETSDAILDDHYRAIDDDAKVQCPEAHQIGADFVMHHACEGKEHGQWYYRGSDNGRTDVT